MYNNDTRIKRSSRSTRWALLAWSPRPLPEPVVDPGVLHRSAVERASVILVYSVLRLEYAVSSDGLLREWARLWLRLSLLLLIPSVLVLPVLVYAVRQIQTLATALSMLITTLLSIVVNIVTIAAIVTTVVAVVYAAVNRRRQNLDLAHRLRRE